MQHVALTLAQAVEHRPAGAADNTIAWLTFVGALLVATIAAATAQWRLRLQLRHDRELHDLGELREVLDEAAAMTFSGLDKLSDALIASAEWEEQEVFVEDPIDAESARDTALLNLDTDQRHRDNVRTARRDAYKVLWPMENMGARLALRLGQSDRVYATFGQFQLACRDVARAVPLERPPPGTANDLRAANKELGALRQEFIAEAQQLVGSKIKSG